MKIEWLHYGFIITGITKASEKKLKSIEETMSEFGFCEWANIDDLGHLSVNFRQMLFTTELKQNIEIAMKKLYPKLQINLD